MCGEIRRLFLGKGFWLGLLAAAAGIAAGASYPKIESGKLLETGSFVAMEAKALYSRAMVFLLPIAGVLPWSDSFLLERQGGFLKSILPRNGKRFYVESKVFTVALGGFLAVTLAGIFMFAVYFGIFFPLEAQGKFPWKDVGMFMGLLLRCGILGGILGTLGGICGAMSSSVYLAFGLPFVAYYFCVILRDRYFEEALWLYPPQWVEGSAKWGEGGMGLWLFLLVLLGVVMILHGGVLYGKLDEI